MQSVICAVHEVVFRLVINTASRKKKSMSVTTVILKQLYQFRQFGL